MLINFRLGAVRQRVNARLLAGLPVVGASLGILLGAVACSDHSLDDKQIREIYSHTAPKPASALTVYHLGHSLIGHDIPAMLQQLAGGSHDYGSQLGWGATLQSHWEPHIPVNGFEQENAHDKYRDVFKAIDSREYDTLILTEMVEVKDAIKHFESAKYLEHFAAYTFENSPNTVVYFYETWHQVDDPAGWRNRLDEDYQTYWLDKILYPALEKLDGEKPIYVIPAGQVMSAFFSALETKSMPGNVQGPEDIFGRDDEGKLDPIHLNDIGEYLVALVHYAVIYQKSPVGLPYALKNVAGEPALAPTKEVAALMQEVTWKIVSNDFRTGIRQ